MKIYWITPGEELESVYKDCGKFGAANWYIKTRTNGEIWLDQVGYNAFLKTANVRAFYHFTDDNRNKFYELQKSSTLFGVNRPTLKTLLKDFTTLVSRTGFSKK